MVTPRTTRLFSHWFLEPTETVTKKEDLATVDLLSDPADANSTKVRFAFKVLTGATETPRELIDWRKNIDRAFTGLNSNTGLLQQSDDAAVLSRNRIEYLQQQYQPVVYRNGKAADVAAAQKAVDDYAGGDPTQVAALAAAVTTATAQNQGSIPN